MRFIPLLIGTICTSIFAVQGVSNVESQRLPLDVIHVVTVPSLDYASLFAEDRSREKVGQPPQFSVPNQASTTPATRSVSSGACCVYATCSVMAQPACNAAGGEYQGDGSTCSVDTCDTGGCEAGYYPDCAGTCFEDDVYHDWVGDGYCDDGAYVPSDYGYGGPAGVVIWLNCDEFDCDDDDCDDDDRECNDPTGACCVGSSCSVMTQAHCSFAGGTYNDDNSSCSGDPCGGGGDPTGACCLGESCSTGTEAECNAAGGSYLGDGSSCSGTPCGGGGCLEGEIEDCNGNCCPDYWVADGYCDDGAYEWNGVVIYLNCDEFGCDGGDCTDCGGGGNCEAGWTEDCQGTCFPDYVYEAWIGDTFCDDGAYVPADYGCTECPVGVAIWLNCEEFDYDGGDCTACCLGESCSTGTEAECDEVGGEWGGPDSTCDADTCASPCEGDVDGNGSVNVSDILSIVAAWGSSDPDADINGDGTVNVSDILLAVAAWGSCP